MVGACERADVHALGPRDAGQRVAGAHRMRLHLGQDEARPGKETERRFQVVGVDDRTHRHAIAPRHAVERFAARDGNTIGMRYRFTRRGRSRIGAQLVGRRRSDAVAARESPPPPQEAKQSTRRAPCRPQSKPCGATAPIAPRGRGGRRPSRCEADEGRDRRAAKPHAFPFFARAGRGRERNSSNWQSGGSSHAPADAALGMPARPGLSSA